MSTLAITVTHVEIAALPAITVALVLAVAVALGPRRIPRASNVPEHIDRLAD